METEAAACLMVPCKDTIKLTADGYIEKTLPRSQLMAAQTPQAFQTELLLRAMRNARADGFEATDDCSIVEAYTDIRIKTVPGNYANKKITTIEDLQ
jgi:2-C-methyl-D-erythritol 4-phosphate cytidylyltransferase